MLIDVVSHCYAKELPHYANALCYQLSSLILHPPSDCDVRATVCYDPSDQRTMDVLRYFSSRVPIKGIPLEINRLGRRAIGRNIAAKGTDADRVWFADVDQCYRIGVLDRLCGLSWPLGASMVYPGEIRIHRNHGIGDAATKRVGGEPQIIDIDPAEFISKRYNRAIGGVQIVRGSFAREHGYLDQSPRWMQPLSGGEFVSCKCDMAYRSFCRDLGPIVKVDLPGVFRLRHTQNAYESPKST